MTQKASKRFIKSLIEILPQNVNFIDIKACCLSMHLVHRLDSGEFCKDTGPLLIVLIDISW